MDTDQETSEELTLKCDPERCPIDTTLSVIGGRWKPVIIVILLKDGTVRFGEIRKILPSISQRILSKQLRELEAAGIVHRKAYAEVPPKVEYSLTEYGKTLSPILDAMLNWGFKHREVENQIPEN